MNSTGWNNFQNQTKWNSFSNQLQQTPQQQSQQTTWNTHPNPSTQSQQTQNKWNSFSNSTLQNKETSVKNLEKKIKNLEKKVEGLSQNISKRKYLEITHNNIICNNCQKNNINGIRYLCGNCPNNSYNLCHSCVKYAEEIHPHNHFFIRIPDTRIWNQINNIQQGQQSNYHHAI